jgi:hypothetical protein
MKNKWSQIDTCFIFKNEKLKISFSTTNPVYGKRCAVYVVSGDEEILVYDTTESGTHSRFDNWIHHSEKIENDCLAIFDNKIKEQDERIKLQSEKEHIKFKQKELKIKNIIDSY